MRSHELGKWGEKLATRFIASKGLEIIDRNWRCEEGEIDIVALDNETLVIVEVRTRTSDAFGTPEESLTREKRRHIQRTALSYLQAHGQSDTRWRIDVIAIEARRLGQVDRITHYENAIEGEQEL